MTRYFTPFILLIGLLCSVTIAAAQPTTSTLRILSLSPHATEMVYTLGAEDQLVGVSDYCVFPPEAKEKTQTGGYMNPNLELMLSLRPDVALSLPGGRELEGKLGARGVEMIAIPGDVINDIPKGLLMLGNKLNRQEAAAIAVEAFEERLESLRRETGENSPRVLMVLGRDPGAIRQLFTVGPNTFIDELITHLGGINVMKDSPAPYPTVTIEPLIANPPDVIIEHLALEPRKLTEKLMEQKRRDWHTALGPRGKNVRIEFLNDKHLSVPGPGILDTAETLAQLIHEGR